MTLYADMNVIRGRLEAYPFDTLGGNPIPAGATLDFSFAFTSGYGIASTDVVLIDAEDGTPLPDGIGWDDSFAELGGYATARLRNFSAGPILIPNIDLVFKILRASTGAFQLAS